MEQRERPIGYWLKHLDGLIEAVFARALAEQALSRRHWQVMNVLNGTPQDEQGLGAALRPFWGEDTTSLAEVTGELVRRSWVACQTDGRYALTPLGQAAHAKVEDAVHDLRRSMSEGVTESEYQTTVRVLGRMADNLERALKR